MPQTENWTKLASREMPSMDYKAGWENDISGVRVFVYDNRQDEEVSDRTYYDIEIWEEDKGQPEILDSKETLAMAKDYAREWIEENPLGVEGDRVGFDKVVAKRNREYIVLNDIFVHDDGMSGATGDRVAVVSEDERDERVEQAYDTDSEYSMIVDLYHQVDDERSLEEFASQTKRHEGDRIVFDWYYNSAEVEERIKELAVKEDNGIDDEMDIAGLEHTGAGRVFPDSMSEMEEKYDKIYDRELLEKVAQVESQ